jgi:hypothetical protein
MESEQIVFSGVCTFCKHLTDPLKRKCDAFRKIPDEIWQGKNPHAKPFKGDHGIHFERAKTAEDIKT